LPAGSSQAGFTLGIQRGNGLLAACGLVRLHMPSALILFAFAMAPRVTAGAEGFLHGLKLVAVAVVAQAIWACREPSPRSHPRRHRARRDWDRCRFRWIVRQIAHRARRVRGPLLCRVKPHRFRDI